MNEVNIVRIQILAILGSIGLIIFILNLIRKKRLREEFSILWLLTAFIFLFISIFRPVLDKFSYLIGIEYPPAALFLILILGLVMVCIHFSIAISELKEINKKLLQELGLLRAELEENRWREK